MLCPICHRPTAVIRMSGWHASAVDRRCDLISIIGTQCQRQRPVNRDGDSGNTCMYSYSGLVSGGHACQVERGFNYTCHAPFLNGASMRCGKIREYVYVGFGNNLT